MKKIREVDIKNVKEYRDLNYLPVIMVLNNVLYKVNNWENAMKIFYYNVYSMEKNKSFIDGIVNKPLFKTERVLFSNDISQISRASTWHKFSSDYYVKVFKDNEKNSNYKQNNFVLLRFILENLNIKGFRLFMYPAEDISTEDGKLAINKMVDKLLKVTKTRKYIGKVGTRYISFINRNIFTPEDNFYGRIEREFDKKILIGDININSIEAEMLKKYMTAQLNRFVKFNSASFEIEHEKVFCYGLVRFGMKYYDKKTFWSFFSNEFGITLAANQQGKLIREYYKPVMIKYGKKYSDTQSEIKDDFINNITMHAFVSDKYANQLFDYLFSYYIHDIYASLDNLYDENNKLVSSFKDLIEEIISYEHPDIMKHTSMAVINNRKGCEAKIRRILQIIDDAWHDRQLGKSNNRLYNLLYSWLEDSNSYFQKLYNKELRRRKGNTDSREVNYHSPLLSYNSKNDKFYLVMPLQRLRNATKDDYPEWTVTIGDVKYTYLHTKLPEDKRGFYIDECTIEIEDSSLIFETMKISLDSGDKNFTRALINSDDVRFFTMDGKIVDHNYKKYGLPVGNIIGFTKSSIVPEHIGNSLITYKVNNLYYTEYILSKGDIVVLLDGHAIQVGLSINTGLVAAEPLNNILANGKKIYTTIPKLLFNATKKQIKGTRFKINDKSYNVDETECKCFKLSNDLSEEKYGYLLDLSKYISNNDIYNVSINIPGSRENNDCSFVYIRNFAYEFIGAPYVFTDNCSLIFTGNLKFKEENDKSFKEDWAIISFNEKVFHFTLSKETDKTLVDDVYLRLNGYLGSTIVEIKISIPALYWKYKKEDEWNHLAPADMALNKVPKQMYFTGPFDFISKKSKLYINSSQDISSRFEWDKNVASYKIKLSALTSYIKDNRDDYGENEVFALSLNGNKYDCLNVVCRSKLLSQPILTADFKDNIIYGDFDIIGDGTYFLDLYFEDEKIIDELPIKNGKIKVKLENDILSGKYRVDIIEHEEDEDTFEGYSCVSVNQKEIYVELLNPYKLMDKTFILEYIQDRKRLYQPLLLKSKYRVVNLKRTSYEEIVTNYDVLSYRFDDVEETYKNAILYEADLCFMTTLGSRFKHKVLLAFVNQFDISDVIILRFAPDEDAYSFMLYDKDTCWFVKNDTDFKQNRKISIYRERNMRLTWIMDDRYFFKLSLGE